MNAHDLARKLLAGPNLPVIVNDDCIDFEVGSVSHVECSWALCRYARREEQLEKPINEFGYPQQPWPETIWEEREGVAILLGTNSPEDTSPPKPRATQEEYARSRSHR